VTGVGFGELTATGVPPAERTTRSVCVTEKGFSSLGDWRSRVRMKKLFYLLSCFFFV